MKKKKIKFGENDYFQMKEKEKKKHLNINKKFEKSRITRVFPFFQTDNIPMDNRKWWRGGGRMNSRYRKEHEEVRGMDTANVGVGKTFLYPLQNSNFLLSLKLF